MEGDGALDPKGVFGVMGQCPRLRVVRWLPNTLPSFLSTAFKHWWVWVGELEGFLACPTSGLKRPRGKEYSHLSQPRTHLSPETRAC